MAHAHAHTHYILDTTMINTIHSIRSFIGVVLAALLPIRAVLSERTERKCSPIIDVRTKLTDTTTI